MYLYNRDTINTAYFFNIKKYGEILYSHVMRRAKYCVINYASVSAAGDLVFENLYLMLGGIFRKSFLKFSLFYYGKL